MVTVPPPLLAGADAPLSAALLLLTELPAQPARRTALTAAAAPARKRVFIGSHLLCPSPVGARVRCPCSCQGRKFSSSLNGGEVAIALRGEGATPGIGGALDGGADQLEEEGDDGHHDGGGAALRVVGAVEALRDQ